VNSGKKNAGAGSLSQDTGDASNIIGTVYNSATNSVTQAVLRKHPRVSQSNTKLTSLNSNQANHAQKSRENSFKKKQGGRSDQQRNALVGSRQKQSEDGGKSAHAEEDELAPNFGQNGIGSFQGTAL